MPALMLYVPSLIPKFHSRSGSEKKSILQGFIQDFLLGGGGGGGGGGRDFLE